MVKRFIHKKVKDSISPRRLAILKSSTKVESVIEEQIVVETPIEEVKEEIIETIEEKEIIENNEDLKEDNVMMDTKEKIQMANAILNAEQPKVKKVKKDKGLIERTESSITILTEDNRELLKG